MAAIKPVERELSGGCDAGGGWGKPLSTLMNDLAYSAGGAGLYGLFQEMEDRDAHMFATLQTRKNALLACPWKVIAGDSTEQGAAAARLVQRNLQRLPVMNGALFHLLDALAKGYAVAELLWRVNPATGEVELADIRARSQGEFAFDGDGTLYLLRQLAVEGATAPGSINPRNLLPRPGESLVMARHATAMPARKFLHFAFQGNGCSPYGAALCTKAYWYYWLKKNTLNHWSLFNEKFGSPTAVARYAATTSDEDLARLESAISTLPQDSGILLPEGVNLEFLEARRASGANTYRELADWCNDEISKIVLGQTLTTTEGRRTGSLALGRVHETVRRDYLASDAAALGQVLTGQLSRWLTDFNFGPEVPAPSIVFDVAPPEQFETELAIDRDLVKMGVPLPATYFYERYRRPAPAPGERTLRYDDANLYQYHLLHGVLTINEVRASLGLPAVAWGDVPTGHAADGTTAGGSLETDLDETRADDAETSDADAARDRRTP